MECKIISMEGTTARIAETVRSAVEASGVTQAKLAQAIGVSVTTIERRMTGKRAFTINEILKIARLLDVSPASLIEENGQ